MSWSDYTRIFTITYRTEVEKLSESEKAVFLWREELLPKPCQIEIIELNTIYRILWLFFFDETKQDFEVSVRDVRLETLGSLARQLTRNYATLKINVSDLIDLLVSSLLMDSKNLTLVMRRPVNQEFDSQKCGV